MSPACFHPRIPLSMFLKWGLFALYQKQRTCGTIFSKIFHSVFMLTQYQQHFLVIHNALGSSSIMSVSLTVMRKHSLSVEKKFVAPQLLKNRLPFFHQLIFNGTRNYRTGACSIHLIGEDQLRCNVWVWSSPIHQIIVVIVNRRTVWTPFTSRATSIWAIYWLI